MKNILICAILSIASFPCFAGEKTLLFFSAEWCKYCKIAKQDMHNKDIEHELQNYSVVNLDMDVDKNLIAGYNIETIPVFIIFENGKEVKRLTGYKGKDQFINFIK